MADTDVGKRATRKTENGDEVVCDVIAYEAGRDGGDHFIFGGAHPSEHTTHGDVFARWAQVGPGNTQFQVRGH